MLITGVLSQPLQVTIQAGQIAADTTAGFNFNTNTVTITGGVPPYTQVWSWSSQVNGTFTFSGSNTATTVTPRVTGVAIGPAATANLTCTVTDSASTVVASPPSAYEYERI